MLHSRRRRTLALVAIICVVTATGCGSSSKTSSDTDTSTKKCPEVQSAPIPVTEKYDPVSSVGHVTVTGTAIPELPQDGADPAISCIAPIIDGQSFAGEPMRVGGATDKPTLVFLGAHWCPHCNEELPKVLEWAKANDIDAKADMVLISTGVQKNQANYPPKAWIADTLHWDLPALADNIDGDAARAFGLTAYPMLVVLDTAGMVQFRAIGAFDLDDLTPLVDKLAKGTPG